MQPAISLVICTRNRATQLPQCLESIARLRSEDEWEFILVDNGSTDDTDRVIREFDLRHNLPLVAIREEQPGLARARNRGLSAARGKIVAFTDDDCYPSPDYLVRVLECFKGQNVKYMGGRVLLFDPHDAPISIQEKPDPEFIVPYSFVRPGFIHGANIAFDRNAILSVGGFDERLGAGTTFCSGEDVEILARMSWAGMRGVYDPQPVVHHHHGRREAADIERLSQGYDIGRGAYFVKFIANKKSRLTYLKHWYWSTSWRNWRSFGREVAGGVRFAMAAIRQRGGLWGDKAIQAKDRP